MKKKRLAGLLAVIMSLSMLGHAGTEVWAAGNTVIKNDGNGIPDAVLYAEILAAADSNKDGVLTVAEAEGITSLSISFPDVKVGDLQGLQYCKNLLVLDLSGNYIDDISALSGLTKLEELNISHNSESETNCNGLSDISALSEMTNLKKLDVSYDPILGITVLSQLKNLEYLNMEGCGSILPTIDRIRQLTNLKYLNMNDINLVHCLHVVSEMTELEELHLKGTNIVYIDSLSELTDLTYLDLSENRISDIRVLSGMTKLTDLNLSHNQISDVTSLSKLTNLKKLDLSYNKITDAGALAGLSSAAINLEENPIGETTAPDEEESSGTETPAPDAGGNSGTTTPSEPDVPSGTVPVSDGWYEENGAKYWYEDGVRQGMEGRGKEIYDPDSNAWYWLDAIDGGKVAAGKDVYQESLAGVWGDLTGADGQRYGKWVRYDENGRMVKGWQYTENGTYYFDDTYGTMAKGYATIDGVEYYFNAETGTLEREVGEVPQNGWKTIDGNQYWYENYVRQGYSVDENYRGKEIYDSGSNAWYWLDNVDDGKKATSKDVYQESLAGDWGDIEGADGQRYGKWVRYDAEGHMIKGWQYTENGTYYFDDTYGTMAKGQVTINGQSYYFDENTGVLK